LPWPRRAEKKFKSVRVKEGKSLGSARGVHGEVDAQFVFLALGGEELGYGVGGGIFDGDGAIEDGIGVDEIARGSGGFENADGSLGDGVVADNVVVAVEEDAGFGGVEDGVAVGTVGTAFETNAIENGVGGGLIVGEDGGIGVDKDTDLADGDGIIGDGDAIGLDNKDVGGDGGASGGDGAGRPNVVGDSVVGDGARGAETDLNAVLRSAGGGANTGDEIAANADFGANFIGGNAIFLEIVDGGGVNGDAGHLAATALHEDASAALAAVQTSGKFEIADGGAADAAGGVLEGNAEELGSTFGDATAGAVDDEAVDGDAGGVGDEKSDGEGGGVEEAGGILDHGGGHENRAVFSVDVERLRDGDLFDVGAGADADFVARRGGDDGGLDGGVGGRGTDGFVDGDEELLGSDGRGEKWAENEENENGEKADAKFHEIPLCGRECYTQKRIVRASRVRRACGAGREEIGFGAEGSGAGWKIAGDGMRGNSTRVAGKKSDEGEEPKRPAQLRRWGQRHGSKDPPLHRRNLRARSPCCFRAS